MTRTFRLPIVVLAAAVALIGSGCAAISPAVGTWKGPLKIAKGAGIAALGMMAMGNQEATVTLTRDGKGFAKLAVAPEQPVMWTEKDGKVILSIGSGSDSAKTGKGSLVGTIAADKQTMTVDLGPVEAELKKQPNP